MSWLKKYVNNTGYLKGEETNKNPINIIPSNHITTDNMAFPIYANGVLLQPNTGDYMFPTNMVVETPVYKSGGYTVKRTNERKGKTHVVIGPGGEKRYFGDPKMGERSKSKYGKEAFYKRHAKNLDKNPFFRAYAKATWQTGGNKTLPSPIPSGYNVFATPNNIYKAPYNPLAPQTLPSDNTTNKIQVLPTNQELKATNNKKTELPIRNKSVQPTTNNNSDTLKNKISVSPQSDLAPLLFQEVRPDTSFINIKNIEDPEHYADSMIDKYRLWRNYSPSTKVNDTLINLTNLPMGWFPFNTYPGQDYTDILGNNYIETNDNRTGKPEDYAKNWKIRIKDPNDTFRNAGYAKEVGSYYHSKDIPAFYGIENDRIKVGKPEDFNENTVIVPVRNSTMPYARVDVEKGLLTDTYYTYDNAGNKIWNLNSKTKFLVHSPVTKQTIYLSNNNNPEFLKNELNKFKENNPDAYIISIDEGRFKYNINAKRANKAILDEDEFKRWTTLGGTILTDYLENIDKPVKTLQDFQGGPPIYSPIENYKYGYNIGILKHKSGGVFKDPPVNPIPSGVNVFATSNSIYKTPNNTTVNKPVEYNPVYKNLAEKNFTQQELAAINNKKPDVLKQDRSIPKPVQLTPFEQKVLEKEIEAQTLGQQRVTYNQFGEPVLKFDPSMPKATGRIEPDYMDPITMAAIFGAGAYGKGLSLADAALVGLDAGTYGASNLGIGAGKLGFNAFKKLYKEVPKPTSSFKSEIDWGKWNPETPNYPKLINEYNAIEESTKKAGTWMKNPDGSAFQGTPEQFVQQQSSWFKKAFPEGFENVFRGVRDKNVVKELNPERSMFTADFDLASNYTINNEILTPFDQFNTLDKSQFNPNVKEGMFNLAHKKSPKSVELDNFGKEWTSIDLTNPKQSVSNIELNIKHLEKQLERQKEFLKSGKQNPDGSWSFPDTDIVYSNKLYQEGTTGQEKIINSYKDRLKNINNLVKNEKELEKMKSVLGDKTTTDDIAKYIEDSNLDYVKIKNVDDSGLGDVSIVNHKKGNYLKSLVGNVGFFDMTNPNIYKAIVPATIGATALGAIEQKKKGDIKTYYKGGLIKRADGSYSKRGLWDNIRANRGSGKEPTKQMLEQERKIKANYQNGGPFKKLNKLRVSSSLFGNKYYNQNSPNFGVNASLFKYEDIGDRYNTLNYGPEVFLNAHPINRKGNIGLGVNLEGFNSQGVNVDLKAGLMSRYDNNKIKFNPYAYSEIGPYYKKRVGKGINRGEQTINPYVFLGTDFYKGPIENSTAGVGLNYNRTFNKKKNTPSIYGDAQFGLDREGGNFSSSPSRYAGHVSAKLGVSGLFTSKSKKPINKETNTPWNYTYKAGGMLKQSSLKAKSKSWLSKYDN